MALLGGGTPLSMQMCGVTYDIRIKPHLYVNEVKGHLSDLCICVFNCVYMYHHTLVASLGDCLQYCGHILNASDTYIQYYAKLRPPSTLEVNLLLTSLAKH